MHDARDLWWGLSRTDNRSMEFESIGSYCYRISHWQTQPILYLCWLNSQESLNISYIPIIDCPRCFIQISIEYDDSIWRLI